MNDDDLQAFERDVARTAATSNPGKARGRYTQILLAYDGSADARAALERVAAVVSSEEAKVTVVTVIPYEAVGAKLDPIEPADWPERPKPESSAVGRQRR